MKRLAQNGAESMSTDTPIYSLNTMLPTVKKHLFLRKDVEFTRVCVDRSFLVKYLVSVPLEVQ